MSDSLRRRAALIGVLLLFLLLSLLFLRCSRSTTKIAEAVTPTKSSSSAPLAAGVAGTAAEDKPEVLSPATLVVPPQVPAGAEFTVAWTGPGNHTDYVTIVAREAADSAFDTYRNTREGSSLKMTASITPGDYEARYVAGVSKKILGRTPLVVTPVAATLDGPAEALQGSEVSVAWTGPNNQGDYVTLVASRTPEGQFGNYTYTAKGSPVTVTVPIDSGEAEFRYMTGQGNKILARRSITITKGAVKIKAPADCIAGTDIMVTWSGPNNAGDYLTLVRKSARDGEFGNYAYTRDGSPLKIQVPIDDIDAEVRYMTGQGAKVLAREPIRINAAKITLSAPEETVLGMPILVDWTGPNNGGDYITIVLKAAPDTQYGGYEYTKNGKSLSIPSPKDAGEYELRYLSGQGAKVLARRAIRVASKL